MLSALVVCTESVRVCTSEERKKKKLFLGWGVKSPQAAILITPY
jgi:hypothetical protein